MTLKRIELKKILEAKNPKLARWIPGFMIRWLESIICATKINYVLDNYSALPPIEFIGATLNYMNVEYTLHDIHNIPSNTKVVFTANHPLGGLDGLILAHGLGVEFPEMETKLIVNDILMNIAPLRPIFVPINKHGSQSAQYARGINELYESSGAVITFPAGLCSRLITGHITDPQWRRNFAIKASKNHRVVVPTYIDAQNSKLFYRVALWRKRLRIKANLEMILLPREMFAQHGKHINIYFGKPIELTEDLSAQQWSDLIRKRTYSLQK